MFQFEKRIRCERVIENRQRENLEEREEQRGRDYKTQYELYYQLIASFFFLEKDNKHNQIKVQNSSKFCNLNIDTETRIEIWGVMRAKSD